MKQILFIILASIFIIVACNPIGKSLIESSGVPTSISESGSSYPVFTPVPSNAGYPYPKTTELDLLRPEQLEIPVPQTDSGVVTGTLLFQESEEPYLNSILILGQISEADQPGYPPLVGYSLDSDPQAVQAKDGTFAFDRISPGKYGIVLWSPLSSFLLSDPQTGEIILVEVKEGEVTDLGTIYIK